MMDKKEFHLLNFDSAELDRQIDIRRKLYNSMIGQLYKSVVFDDLTMLLNIKYKK